MPRVSRRKDTATASSQLRSPRSLPLHDDQHEKAARFQSRQAIHEFQLKQIRAAASPGHRRAQYEQATNAKTSSASGNTDNVHETEASAWGGFGMPGMANMKRVPILANFEEWMKMATDNKINATNSWNFALIDYFHDMSLLKEGDSVNFQKASCTLDGCVKIYTSRVDSVATETGKLLSGLADSDSKPAGDTSGYNEEDEEDGEEGDGQKKSKKRTTRSSEATLATSFAQLQLRKFELEFSVDPLFKKASADFDEGGAKGLLLNHLCIGGNGRIIFDSSDDTEEATDREAEVSNDKIQSEEIPSDNSNLSGDTEKCDNEDIDIDDLRKLFFPDLNILDAQDVCPSLKNLDLGDTMDLANLPLLQDHKRKDSDKNPTHDDDAELLALGTDSTNVGLEPDFGNGGEAWAHEAGLEPMFGIDLDAHDHHRDTDDNEDGEMSDGEGSFGIKMHFGTKDDGRRDILGYFDNTAKSNWAGPEHWRIKKMKKETASRESTKRKEKAPFEIDFLSSMPQKVSEQIYTSASSNSAISLPKLQWRSKTRHLLPDDKHFNSSHLLRLFLKPKARLGRRSIRKDQSQSEEVYENLRHVDNAYWANSQDIVDSPLKQGYNVDFFREDDTTFPHNMLEDGDEFADARETFSPAFEQDEPTTTMSVVGTETNLLLDAGFGSSLVTKSRRSRPEYMSYAKVAKKVDVRLLKEKMWKGIDLDQDVTLKNDKTEKLQDPQSTMPLKFTSVVNGLQDLYTPEAMAEISTSYCFISLLHLANEKGLVLTNEPSLDELHIGRDLSIEVSAAA